MNVTNKSGHGVFVAGYGAIPPGESAVVKQSNSVKELVKQGVLKVEQPKNDKEDDK